MEQFLQKRILNFTEWCNFVSPSAVRKQFHILVLQFYSHGITHEAAVKHNVSVAAHPIVQVAIFLTTTQSTIRITITE